LSAAVSARNAFARSSRPTRSSWLEVTPHRILQKLKSEPDRGEDVEMLMKVNLKNRRWGD